MNPRPPTTHLRQRWRRQLQRLKSLFHAQESSETASLISTAILIGVLAGLAAVGFDWLVGNMAVWIGRLRNELSTLSGALTALLVPALGGLLITPAVVAWAPDVRGSGIPSVMLAVSNLGGRVPRRLLFWRPLASAISIGSGASLGTEGPVVQLGASLASFLAGGLGLNDERRRNLVAVAAAGGIAATFNAPMAGVLFALEVVLGQFQTRYFASVVIGAVSATAVSRTFLGDTPAFAVPTVMTTTPLELPLYLLLGLLCAALAILFLRLTVVAEDLFNRLPLTPWLRPALGGLLVGLLGLALPQVLGRGFETTGRLLLGEPFPMLWLLALLLAKGIATGISLGSWGSGGVFAPVLLIGAAFGALFAQGVQALLPDQAIAAEAFALVSMAALFSGVTRAPMSSIVMVFELSGSYSLILPLLFSAVIATLVADIFHPESFYQLALSRRGLSLLRLREIDLMQTVRVQEVMDRDIPRLDCERTVADLAQTLLGSHHHGFVVTRDTGGAEPEMVGIVTLTDLERARQAGLDPATPIEALCQKRVHVAHPDEAAAEVLERMAQLGIGRMPVVEPAQPTRPVGFVRQTDLARAYYLALQRERHEEEVLETLRLRDLTGQEIVEVRVPRGSRLAGTTLREARLPRESIVVAVRRKGKTLFPHGETTIEPGDTVVANVAPGFSSGFRSLFAPGDGPKEGAGGGG